MRENDELNKLFKEWEVCEGSNDGNFFKDGIINEAEYLKQKNKVLYIAKQPNNANHKEAEKDFRKEWYNKVPDYRFASQINNWSAGLLNGFPKFDKIDQSINYLQRIAFMNLKKSSGGGNSHRKDFNEYLSDGKILEFIRKEIEIIEPTIIILGIIQWKGIRGHIFPDKRAQWTASGHGIDVGTWNGAKLIDFYHPSSRIPSCASYALLEKVIKGNS